MNKLMIVSLLAAVAAGCITNHKNDGGDSNLKPAIVRDIAYEKYDISEKQITATDQKVGILPYGMANVFTVGGLAKHLADNVEVNQWTQESIRYAQNGAYAAACEKSGCDSIVGARYDVVYEWYFLWNTATVTVTGYPAKLTGVEFRPAQFKDQQ